MAIKRGPTLRSQWLGQQLHEARERAKIRMQDVAEHMLRDQGTISRWEAGIVPPKPADVLALLNLYGVDELAHREALDRLSRESWRKGWWDGYTGQVAHDFIDYAWLEDRATLIRSADALVIPGLIQTPDYADAVIRTFDPDASAERIKRWLQFRVKRQDLLIRDDPPALAYVLDEALLRRPVGGPDVMRAQLHHLLDLADRPNTTVQVLPFSTGGHSGQQGAFQIFELPEPYPEVAYAETLAGSIYVESDKVDRFIRAYDQLRYAALPPDESVALISAAGKELT